jgi:hypothetical protein
MTFLIPEIFILLLLDAIFALFLLISLSGSIKIYFRWDSSSTSQRQYGLEKKSVLINALVRYIFYMKIPLFLYYIYTNDKLANVITGAMCAAGSINAANYGDTLLYLKIVNLFLVFLWLSANKINSSYPNMPFTKKLFGALVVIIFCIVAEIIISVISFSSIDPTAIATCCSTLFTSTSDDAPLIFSLPGHYIFILYAVSYFILLAFYFTKNILYYALFNLVYFIFSILSLIVFTSTYVYELPTHKCPYCILQSDYHFVGYFFYTFIYFGVALGLATGLKTYMTNQYPQNTAKLSVLFNTLYFLLSCYYPISFYLSNKVWL